MDEDEKLEKRAKAMKRMDKKVSGLLEELGDEILDEEEIEMVENKIKTIFKDKSILWSTTTLKALNEGIKMVIAANNSNQEEIPFLLMVAISAIIKAKDKKTEEITVESLKNMGKKKE